MKRTLLLFLALTLIFHKGLMAQDKISGREFTMGEGDSITVMKKYFLCLYVSGPNRGHTATEAAELQIAHLAYNDKLAKAGKIVLAGPFEVGKNDRLRGLLVFDTETIEEAAALVCQDPMVRVSRLDFEMVPWWTAKGGRLP
jgi:uncharacterized protein